MKKNSPLTRIKAFLLLSSLLFSLISYATTYTASTSGNWSSSATWVGGNAPPFSVTSDAVIIPAGITVTMDNSADFTSALASLDVEGTLTSVSGKSLTINNGASLTGSVTANITVSSLTYTGTVVATFAGTATVDTLTNNATVNTQSTAMLTVVRVLNLAGGTLTVNTGGTLIINNQASINVGAGLLAVNGGSLNFSSPYNVVYVAGATTAGLELTGPGLNNVTIAIGTGNTLALTGDLTVAGNLNLASGSLLTGANTLTIDGGITGVGKVSSSALTNIIISTPGGTNAPLNFADSSKVLNFTVNTGAGSKAHISGNLSILGGLTLTSGTLQLDSISLTINSVITGSGTLGSDSLSDITVNSTVTLNFASGAGWAHNLNIGTGFGGSVVLAGNLVLKGLLNLPGFAALDISNDTLTIDSNITGSGYLLSNAVSSLIINTNANIISPLNIVAPALGSLTVNVGRGNSVGVARNLNITGALNLQSGTLNIADYSLALSGTVSGNGTLSGNSVSDVTIATTGGSGGVLNFATGSVLNSLIVNVGIGRRAQIGGDVNVADTLALTSGILDIGKASLTISGITTGTGGFSGTDSSDLIISVPNGLSNPINFANGGQMLHNFTIHIDSGSSVTFGTVLRIAGTLSLSSGSILNIQQDSLILNGDMTGSGQLAANAGTVLEINGPSGLSSNVTLSGPIGTFAVNTGNADSIVLGSDLSVSNTLSLQSGILVLNGHNLTVTGNIASNSNGTISANNLSNITVNTTGALSGGLGFTSGANSVNNFWLHATGSLVLHSGLMVDSTLTLDAGKLDIGNDTLIIANGGTITGGDSSAYIIATGNGALGLYLNQGDSSWVRFTVGTGANYVPVSLQLNSGSDGGIVYASVNSGVLAQGTQGSSLSASNPLVNATWMVEPSFTSHVNVNMMTTWPSSLEVNNFNHDSAYIAHYTNGAWDQTTYATAAVDAHGYYNIQRHGITSFSPFAVFGRSIDTSVTTAISSITGNAVFEIFPNPASDNLTIKNISGTNNLNIDIINLTGQIIASYKLTDYTTNISLAALSSGNYYIKLYDTETRAIKQFVKM